MASQRTEPTDDQVKPIIQHVPVPLRVTAAWSWRIVVIGIVAFAVITAFATLAPIVLPLIIALLIAAPLERLVTQMQRIGIPRGLGSLLAILLLIVVVLGLIVAAGSAVVRGFDELRVAAIEGFDQLVKWLEDGPLHVSGAQIDEAVKSVTDTVRENAWGLASGALTVTGTIGALFAGIIIALLSLFFFMRDGRSMWLWAIKALPGEDTTERVDRAGTRAWDTLRRYTQTSAFVAFIDAVGIGLAAWILGVPLALPIAIFVFLFSFIPLFGAAISGAVAVLVALVSGGPVTALIMLGAVLLVQQIEGNVLYPWLFGKAASVHPMAILLTVSAGTLLAGLVGAVIAVPILAFFNTFFRGLHKEYTEDKDERPPISTQIPILAHKSRDAIRRATSRITHTGEIRVSDVKQADAPSGSAGPDADFDGDQDGSDRSK